MPKSNLLLDQLARRTRTQRTAELTEGSTMYAPLQRPAVELKIKGPEHGLKIAVIPDVQAKRDVPINHLAAAGEYIARKRPDVIVCIGDFADVPSLSTHEKDGSIHVEGARYREDVDATKRAMEALMEPIAKAKRYDPVKILTYGNHEDRINRAVASNPRQLEGVYSLKDLGYEEFGWRCIPFLQPIVVAGVAFCHYFPRGVMGKPVQSPAILLKNLHMSAFAGHQQGRDIAYSKRADGSHLTAIISGSFYQHDEHYLSPFTNRHWRGMWMLHEVKDGRFDEMALSLNYLLRRFT